MATADYPAAATYGPWVASTSAMHPCRHCRWRRPSKVCESDDEESDDEGNGGQDRGASSRAARTQQQVQRSRCFTSSMDIEYTWPQIRNDIDEVQAITSAKERKAKMSEFGFNSTIFPLHPDYLPLVDPTRMQPQDIMHLFLCGITRQELYYLLDHLVKQKYTTWEAINGRITSMRIPKGKRIPKLYPAAKGKKAAERHLDMTASEVLIFAKLRCVNKQLSPHHTLNPHCHRLVCAC